MQWKLVLILLFVVVLFVGCQSGEPTGTLEFRYTTWSQWAEEEAKVDTITCTIVDTRGCIYSIDVSTGDVVEGEVDTLDWMNIYTSSEELLASQRRITVDLPVGNYKTIRFYMRNKMYWVCVVDGDTVEFESYNFGELEPGDTIVNVFSPQGLFYYDEEGCFVLGTETEKIGGFEIRENVTTNVTLRQNLLTLDWIDADSNGVWSDGDMLDNWTSPEGIETMVDFIVEYEGE